MGIDELDEPGVDPAVLDPAVLDSAVLDSAVLDSAVLDSAVLDPAVLDPAGEGGTPPPPVTGDAKVDEAITRLGERAGEPLDAQLAEFESAHRALQDRLADVEG